MKIQTTLLDISHIGKTIQNENISAFITNISSSKISKQNRTLWPKRFQSVVIPQKARLKTDFGSSNSTKVGIAKNASTLRGSSIHQAFCEGAKFDLPYPINIYIVVRLIRKLLFPDDNDRFRLKENEQMRGFEVGLHGIMCISIKPNNDLKTRKNPDCRIVLFGHMQTMVFIVINIFHIH